MLAGAVLELDNAEATESSLGLCLPSASGASSMTSPIRMLMTPRKPWSFFLNFFWSKTCTARMVSSLTVLRVSSARWS